MQKNMFTQKNFLSWLKLYQSQNCMKLNVLKWYSSKDQPSAVKKLLIPVENDTVIDGIYQNQNKIEIPSS